VSAKPINKTELYLSSCFDFKHTVRAKNDIFISIVFHKRDAGLATKSAKKTTTTTTSEKSYYDICSSFIVFIVAISSSQAAEGILREGEKKKRFH
jgi:hypothetical protein